MNAESLSFLMLATGILATHAATLRLLYHCKRELAEHILETTDRQDTSSQSLEEIVRIGADIADAVEGVVSGLSVVDSGSSPVLAKPASLQDTIIQLMLDRFLPNADASETQQEWPIRQDEPEKENNEQDDDPETTQV